VPVSTLYQELEDAEMNKSEDTYTIYSDSEDIRKYSEKMLGKYAPTLLANGQIKTRGVQRGVETTDISGTKMRQYLEAEEVQKFSELLPPAMQRHSAEIIDMLKNKIREGLLRVYTQELLKEHQRR
jgi:3-oxoacyl-ACP reductase-like protein